jgi:uncharacterized protein
MDQPQPEMNAREHTPEARAAEIIAVEGPRIVHLVNQAVALLGSRAPIGHKFARLTQITEGISRAVVPHTECRNGCSHCCHQAVTVMGPEVRAIERATGRHAIPQHRAGVSFPGLGGELRQRFSQVPCTFLHHGRCTIYPARPLACRLHHSLEASSDNCNIAKHPGNSIASLNLPMTAIIAQAFLQEDRGDIREFFPPAPSSGDAPPQ